MITLHPLMALSLAEIDGLTGPFTCHFTYQVHYSDSASESSFTLKAAPLAQPFTNRYDHFDQETMERYSEVLKLGYSVGAYDGERLVGMLLAETREWNSSLWVWEFHVAAEYRGQGIGRLMMDWAAEKAKAAGMRTIICETQNQNYNAIQAYRKLGFQLEGIDISYYTNEDYPDRGIAVFMKRRI